MWLTGVIKALRRGRPALHACAGVQGLPGAPLVIIVSASSWLMSCREGQLIRSHAGYALPAAAWQAAEGLSEAWMRNPVPLCSCLGFKTGADLETC